MGADFKREGFKDHDIIDANFDASCLHVLKIPAKTVKARGFTSTALRMVDLRLRELVNILVRGRPKESFYIVWPSPYEPNLSYYCRQHAQSLPDSIRSFLQSQQRSGDFIVGQGIANARGVVAEVLKIPGV